MTLGRPMRRHLFLAALLLALTPSQAQTQSLGAHLAWDNCPSEGGTQIHTSACNTNDGSTTLVVSFEWAGAGAELRGMDLELQILGTDDNYLICDFPPQPCPLYPLPSYWLPCRSSAFSVSTDFTVPPFNTSTTCIDVIRGRAPGGYSYFGPTFEPGMAKIRAVSSMPEGADAPLVDGEQYYAYQIRFSNQQTTGNGACAGCCTSVSMVAALFRVFYTDSEGQHYIDYFIGDYPRWHGAAAACAVSTANPTWGWVKVHYR